MARDQEMVVRVARIPEARRRLAIFAGDPPTAVTAVIVAVSLRSGRGGAAPTYVLYYFDDAGRAVALAQHETVRAALREGQREAGIEPTAWVTCRIKVPDDGRVDPDLLCEGLLNPRGSPLPDPGEGAR